MMMPDFLGAVEFTAKAVRAGFACVGAVVDHSIPSKPVFGHPLPNPELERLKRNPETMARLHEAEDEIDQAVSVTVCSQCGKAMGDDNALVSHNLAGVFCSRRCIGLKAMQRPATPAVSATDAVEEPSPAGAPVPAGDVPHTGVVVPSTVTRVVLVHGKYPNQTVTEKWAQEWDLYVQDDGRTLKLFAKQPTGPRYEWTPGFLSWPDEIAKGPW